MKYDEFREQLGKTIRAKREALGYSQESFGDEINIHRTYVGDLERAEKDIRMENLLKVTKGLGIRLSDLIRDVERELE